MNYKKPEVILAVSQDPAFGVWPSRPVLSVATVGFFFFFSLFSKLMKDWSILGVGQVDAAASSVSGLLLHLIIPARSPFHSSPLNYTHDWGKWLTVENVTSFLWYSICLNLMTFWKMNVSGGQLNCLSALQHQVVLVKCKIKCNTIVQLFPIHLELPSNRATHNAFVSGKRWEALIKKQKKQKLKCCILTMDRVSPLESRKNCVLFSKAKAWILVCIVEVHYDKWITEKVHIGDRRDKRMIWVWWWLIWLESCSPKRL